MVFKLQWENHFWNGPQISPYHPFMPPPPDITWPTSIYFQINPSTPAEPLQVGHKDPLYTPLIITHLLRQARIKSSSAVGNWSLRRPNFTSSTSVKDVSWNEQQMELIDWLDGFNLIFDWEPPYSIARSQPPNQVDTTLEKVTLNYFIMNLKFR